MECPHTYVKKIKKLRNLERLIHSLIDNVLSVLLLEIIFRLFYHFSITKMISALDGIFTDHFHVVDFCVADLLSR